LHPNHGTTLSFRWYAKRYAGTFLVGEHDSEDPLPKRSGSSLGSPSSHLLDGQEGLSAGVDVNLMSTERSASLPNQTDDVENDDDGKSQPSLEEAHGDFTSSHLLEAYRPNSDVELSDKDETQEDETEPRSVDTSSGGERKLLDRVTLNLPGLSESNVAHADGHPGEDGGKTRKGQEPVKDLTTVSGDVDIGDRSEDQDGDDRGQRSTGLVNVGEDSGSETGLGESGQGSRSGVDTRETDREDGDTDGGVDQVVETLDVGVGKDQNERRSLGVVTRGPGEKSLVIVGD